MRISVIMGSPRKKDSYRICKLIEGYFTDTSNAEFEYLFLKDYHIMDCKGCDQCFQGGGAKADWSIFEKAIAKDKLPVPTFYEIFMFQCLRSKTFVSEADHDFWNELG